MNTDKLIADFLEIENDETGYINNPKSELYNSKYTFITHRMSLEELDFRYSWDSLMVVVEKIESLGYPVDIFKTAVSIHKTGGESVVDISGKEFESKIEAVYKACIEFIKWYNDKI